MLVQVDYSSGCNGQLSGYYFRPNFDLKQRFGDWTVDLLGRVIPVPETSFQIQIMAMDSVQKIDHCVNIQSVFVIGLLYDVYKSVL